MAWSGRLISFTASGLATQIGTTDYTDSMPGGLNGIYALAAIPPFGMGLFDIAGLALLSGGQYGLEWESDIGYDSKLNSVHCLQPRAGLPSRYR